MAMEDYLGGGKFGQVAGSLLQRRNSNYKKALGVELFSQLLQQWKGQKQQDNIQTISKTNKEFQQILDNSDEIWNQKQTERDLFRGFQRATRQSDNAQNTWLENETIKRFNEDAHIRSEMGENAYSTLRGDTWTETSKTQARDYFDLLKTDLVKEIEGYRDDKAITAPTKTKFNRAIYDELDAQLAMVEDDPAGTSAVLTAFGNIFGTHDKKRAELTTSLREARRIRAEQEDTYTGVSYDKDDNIIVKKVARTLKNEFDFITTAEDINRRQVNIKTKIQDKDYEALTKTDAIEAFSIGVNPTNIKSLTALQQNDMELFVTTFNKVKQINSRMPNVDASNFLNIRELDVYDTAMGITREGVDLMAAMQNEVNRTAVVTSILNKSETEVRGTGGKEDVLANKFKLIQGDFSISSENKDTSTGQSNQFVSNVLKAAEILEKKYDVSQNDSIPMAIEMQLKGINYKGGRDEEQTQDFWGIDKDFQTHSVEFVNPDVENLPLLPETASQVADNINKLNYLQKTNSYEDDNGTIRDYTPEAGKTFTLLDPEQPDFEIVFTVETTNPQGKTIPPRWVATTNFLTP